MDIIATNNLSERKIKSYAKGKRGYLSFAEGNNDNEIFGNLKSQGYENIDLRDIIIKYRSDLRKAVINFSGELNCSVPHKDWWAIGMSRRVAMYPFSSGLAKLFIMSKIIKLDKWDTCVVYDNSIYPWIYLKGGKHRIGADIFTEYSMNTDWKYRLKMTLPVDVFLWAGRKINVKNKLGWKPLKINKERSEARVLMFTLIDRNNFVKEGTFRDIYLGDLANHLEENGQNVLILGKLHEDLTEDLLKHINYKYSNPFYLLDYFWSFKNLLDVTKRSLLAFFRNPPVWPQSYFADFDVRRLLDASLHWDLQASYSDCLMDYRASERCLEQISPDFFVYPYENKCFERMFLRSVSETHPDTTKIGYQHAVLTPKHIHMFLAKGESQTMPLPDKIVTNGPYTASLLDKDGNYPDGMVMKGTALRQITAIPDNFVKKHLPEKVRNVLVTLAEGREEYDKGFIFLKEIQSDKRTDMFEFRIRLHPGIPYDPFRNERLLRELRHTRDTTPSLIESLFWADVVLYASTSVAVQAMGMGIPVIWMDLLDFWGNDPISDEEVLRWNLSSPDEWGKVISEIEQLSQDEFERRRYKSKNLVSEYFSQEQIDLKKWLAK